MFKKTLREGPNAQAIAHLLERILVSNGFKDLCKEGNPPTCRVNTEKGLLICEARKVFPNKKYVFFSITLRKHDLKPAYLVAEFNIEGVQCALGSDVLGYHGKRLARDYDPNAPLDDYWTIYCPRDLAALLRSYDEQAHIYGIPTIFGLSWI